LTSTLGSLNNTDTLVHDRPAAKGSSHIYPFDWGSIPSAGNVEKSPLVKILLVFPIDIIDLANLIEKKKFKKKVRYGRFELAG